VGVWGGPGVGGCVHGKTLQLRLVSLTHGQWHKWLLSLLLLSQVSDMGPESVLFEIEKLILKVAQTIVKVTDVHRQRDMGYRQRERGPCAHAWLPTCPALPSLPLATNHPTSQQPNPCLCVGMDGCMDGWMEQGEGFTYEVPTRSATNQLYIAELDRIVLSDKARTIMTDHITGHNCRPALPACLPCFACLACLPALLASPAGALTTNNPDPSFPLTTLCPQR
jgi:hypothetical protein